MGRMVLCKECGKVWVQTDPVTKTCVESGASVRVVLARCTEHMQYPDWQSIAQQLADALENTVDCLKHQTFVFHPNSPAIQALAAFNTAKGE